MMNQKGSPIFQVNFGNLISTTQVGYKKSRESRHFMHEHDRSTTLLLSSAFIIQNVQLQGTLEEHGKIEYSIHLSSKNKLKRSMPSIYYINQYQNSLKRSHIHLTLCSLLWRLEKTKQFTEKFEFRKGTLKCSPSFIL